MRAPETLSLTSNYAETVTFFNHVRNHGLRGSNKIWLNFAQLETITPGAALVLAAEVDRWRRLGNFRLILDDPKAWRSQARTTLSEMGLFDLVEAENTLFTDQTNPRKYIPIKSGDRAIGEVARSLRMELEEIAGVLPRQKVLYGALVEAMKNTLQHAYPSDGDYPHPVCRNRWWMTAGFDRGSSRLSIMFYDQGVGIPNSLPRVHTRELVRDLLSRLSLGSRDAHLIKAAMEVGRSRTGQSYRGTGLQQIRDYVEGGVGDRFRIISGDGEYVIDSEGRESLHDKPAPLGGTLIQWDIGSGA